MALQLKPLESFQAYISVVKEVAINFFPETGRSRKENLTH